MSQIVQSDGVGLLFSRESSPGVQPAAAWVQLQPNPGGITGFQKQLVTVERHILSGNLTPERGEVVGYDVAPKLVQDLNKDLLDAVREPLFRSVTKHCGGTGLSLFRPTAVTNGSPSTFTVPALGALQAGSLVLGAGFTNAANNGLHVVGASSTGTTVKTTDSLVSETPPANAALLFAGFQGAAGDLQIDASGNLISTVADFTTMGLYVGQDLYIGDPTSGAAFAFANALYTGKTTIVAISATKVTLKWRVWTVGAADTGATKTIRILFTNWIRNVPITDADYLVAPTGSMEVSEPGAGTAAATDYTYVGGCGLDSLELAIPLEGKIVATLGFVGMNASEPGPTRATGASTALAPLAASIFATSAQVRDVRLLKQSDETLFLDDIDDLKIAVKNNIKPRKAIGTDGAKGLTFGEYTPTADLDVYLISNDATRAADANTDVVLTMLLKSADGGFSMSFPMGKLRKPDKTYAAATAVMQKLSFVANRDPATGLLWSMTQFAYLP